ncbi:hypothetical protein ES708_27670 [subsurface metagenome]
MNSLRCCPNCNSSVSFRNTHRRFGFQLHMINPLGTKCSLYNYICLFKTFFNITNPNISLAGYIFLCVYSFFSQVNMIIYLGCICLHDLFKIYEWFPFLAPLYLYLLQGCKGFFFSFCSTGSHCFPYVTNLVFR